MGNSGDIVSVPSGYARNYLIPSNIAVYATEHNVKLFKIREAKLHEKTDKEINDARKIADKLNSITLDIKMKADEVDNLYGSVNSRIISDSLYEQHKLKIDSKRITITDVIKKLGQFPIEITLHSSVVVTLNVIVSKN